VGLPFTIRGVIQKSNKKRPPDANPADYCSDMSSEWDEEYYDEETGKMQTRRCYRPIVILTKTV